MAITGDIKSHTGLRGIAALMVVIYHYLAVFPVSVNFDNHTQIFSRGYLWVDLFFMLSGFILSHVYGVSSGCDIKAFKSFLVARFARIYPLHISTLLFLVCWQIFLPYVSNQKPEIGGYDTFWLNILNVHAWGMLKAFDWNFPSWSISVEFAAYLSFPVISFFCIRNRRVTFIILGLTVLFPILIGRTHWEQTALLHGLPMFFIGIMLFHFQPIITKVSLSLLQSAVTCCLIAALHFGASDVLIFPLFAGLIHATRIDTGPIAKLLTFSVFQSLGNWSYSIYLLHIPVRIITAVAGPKVLPTMALFPVSVALTLIGGVLSFHFFEMPMRRYLRQHLQPKMEQD